MKTLAVLPGVFVLAYLPDGVYSLIVPNFDEGTGKYTIITMHAYEIACFFGFLYMPFNVNLAEFCRDWK